MLSDDKKDYIEVTVAVIRRSDSFLVAKRPEGKAFAGKWEFPGGKIEPMESPETCLIREIQEELGVPIIIREPLTVLDYEYPNGKKFKFHVYLCELEGEPQSLWHSEILWLEGDNLGTVDLLEADKEIIPLIRKN
jgi:8-oxo-dGTP diphosphatase